jgi:hypothetical protein
MLQLNPVQQVFFGVVPIGVVHRWHNSNLKILLTKVLIHETQQLIQSFLSNFV